MSPARHSHSAPVLMAAHRGGESVPAPARMHPSEIPLTLSANVLRLKCTMNARAVLAEIVSFHAATGLCDASDSHFAARLSISLDTVSRAVKELEAEGLVHKVTTRVEKILYRTLTPKPDAIAAKAAANPYPQNQGTGTRKMPEGYPQNQGTPTRKIGVGVPAKSVGNTPLNIPVNFQENKAAGAAGAGPEENEELASLPASPDAASHTGGAATDVATSVRKSEATDKTDKTDTGRTKPVGPRGWAYDPAAIAENLVLPFDTPEFRAAWVAYRTYREEMKYPRLNGGMQEQEVLRKLGMHAASNQQLALDMISAAIEKGWQHLYKPDSNATARPSSANRNRPAAGNGRVETLPSTKYGSNRRGPAPAGSAA